jgi:hypothetical protein
LILRVSQNIGDMNCSTLNSGSPGTGPTSRSECGFLPELDHIVGSAIVGHITKGFAVKTVYVPPTSSAELHSILNKRLKNRLKIERRSTNLFQHIGSRRLLLEGLLQLACACPHLLEQPRVLYGDHRLVRKGSDKIDLLLREATCLRSRRGDHTDRTTVFEQGDSHDAAVIDDFRTLAEGIVGISMNVPNFFDSAVEDTASRGASPPRRDRIVTSYGVYPLGR